ncbi:hypothetical protein ISTM_402 [Insectomime virus]|uniref:Uncharacterized protein n=1 Tax=Tunisvirus fontaine2 TaxID=1421067 RepID=V9SH86_9VIRU|nr:hypothetical protein D1R32_gp400 [Tunisvirus fontaine2]AHA46300.1 hypothetical protein ISTM_402 [Insectomime virus]AHC55117.1 hypothetical protein TNS_ORF399 [Tunisvirus fontaine2]
MESDILEVIKNFLSEECLLSDKDYEFSVRHTVGSFGDVVNCSVSLGRWRNHLCSWSELTDAKGRSFQICGRSQTREACIDIIKLNIRNNKLFQELQATKMKRLAEENAELQKRCEQLSKHNKKLWMKNKEMKYAPGGKGFEKSRQHFMGLM